MSFSYLFLVRAGCGCENVVDCDCDVAGEFELGILKYCLISRVTKFKVSHVTKFKVPHVTWFINLLTDFSEADSDKFAAKNAAAVFPASGYTNIESDSFYWNTVVKKGNTDKQTRSLPVMQ